MQTVKDLDDTIESHPWRYGGAIAVIALGIGQYILHLDFELLVVLSGSALVAGILVARPFSVYLARHSLPGRFAPNTARWRDLGIAFDLLILLAAIEMTGGVSSPLLILLPTYVFALDFKKGWRAGAVASGCALLAIGVLSLTNSFEWHLGRHSALLTESTPRWTDVGIVLACLGSAIYVGIRSSREATLELRVRGERLAHSEAQLEHRVQELTAQREIGQQLASSLQLDTVLDTIGQCALRLIQATDVHLIPFDEATDQFGAPVGVWADGRRRAAIAVPRENGLSRAVIRAGRPILIDHVENHPLYSTAQARQWELKSIAGFPIKKGKRIVGVLNAAYNTDHHFTDDERDALLALADQAALAIENASLYTQVEQRMRELGALYRVHLGISNSLEPKQMLDEALAALERVMRISAGLITLRDPVSGQITVAAYRGLSPIALENLNTSGPRSDEGCVGRVFATGEPVIVRDAGTDSLCLHEFWRTGGFHALVSVPLKTSQAVAGVLQLARLDPIEFTSPELSLLNAIAQQIAVSLENARLYAEAQRRADELASLREIGLATTSTLDLREQLRRLHTQIQQLIHPDAFDVGLYDPVRQEITFRYVVDEGWELRGPVVPLDAAGLAAWVIRTGRPLRVDDSEKESARLPASPTHETRPARSWLGVPLLARNTAIGILSLQSSRAYAFSADDERFVVSVAQQAALAMENARLYDTAKQRARELQMVNEISRAITALLDVDEILQRTVRGLADEFGYQFASVYLTQGQEFRLQAQVGYDQAPPALAFSHGVSGRVARTLQPALIRDVLLDPDYVPGAPGVRAGIMIPLRREKRIVGLLCVEDRRSEALTEEDVTLLSTFGDQIGIAVVNAELYRTVVERERTTAALRRLGSALTSTWDTPTILDFLCQESLELFAVQEAHVWLTQGTDIVGQAARGTHSERLLGLRIRADDRHLFPAQVIRERRALFANDVQHETPGSAYLDDVFKARSLLGIPLLVQDQPFGALVLIDSRSPQRFGPSDLETGTLLANQVWGALARTRVPSPAGGRAT